LATPRNDLDNDETHELKFWEYFDYKLGIEPYIENKYEFVNDNIAPYAF